MLENKSPAIDGIPAALYQTIACVTEWFYVILQKLTQEKKLTETMHTSIVKLFIKREIDDRYETIDHYL